MNSPVLGSRGWRMAVHEPNTLPAMFDEGFDILPGISTSISLTSMQTYVYIHIDIIHNVIIQAHIKLTEGILHIESELKRDIDKPL